MESGAKGAGAATGLPWDFCHFRLMMLLLFLSSKAGCPSFLHPRAGWEHHPVFLGENLFWEELKQTNQPLRGTNRSMKVALSLRREPMMVALY